MYLQSVENKKKLPIGFYAKTSRSKKKAQNKQLSSKDGRKSKSGWSLEMPKVKLKNGKSASAELIKMRQKEKF